MDFVCFNVMENFMPILVSFVLFAVSYVAGEFLIKVNTDSGKITGY